MDCLPKNRIKGYFLKTNLLRDLCFDSIPKPLMLKERNIILPLLSGYFSKDLYKKKVLVEKTFLV